jgi:hypothetical protein
LDYIGLTWTKIFQSAGFSRVTTASGKKSRHPIPDDMLNDIQIEILFMLSFSVWLGLFWGGLSGALAGAVIYPIRTRRFINFFPGAFCAVLPATALAISTSLVISILEMVLIGGKGGWLDAPVWVDSIDTISVSVAGVAGAFIACRPHKPIQLGRGVFFWASAGALLGALASLAIAFDNEHFIIGFITGGTLVALWRLGAQMLQNIKTKPEAESQSAFTGSATN